MTEGNSASERYRDGSCNSDLLVPICQLDKYRPSRRHKMCIALGQYLQDQPDMVIVFKEHSGNS